MQIAAYARFLQKDVEPAKHLRALCDQLAHVAYGSEIGLDDRAVSPERLDLGQRFFGAARVTVVVDDNVGALLGQTNRNPAANALAAARDEHLSTEQPIAARSDRCGERRTVHA